MKIEILYLILGFFIGNILSFILFKLKKEKLKRELQTVNFENISLKAKLEAQNDIKKEKEELIELIKNDFTSLANSAIIEKNKILQEENKASLEIFLNPLKEKIKEFQIKVEKTGEEGNINTATIKEKIEELIKESGNSRLATEKLSEAISKNSKSRGILGEMILEKLLNSSGLTNKKENPEKGNFEVQKSFKDKNTGNNKIVDAIIYLAGENKSIIIDSKAPLANFLNYIEKEDEKSLLDFYKDTKDRIDELSGKYDNLEGVNSPDFTLMFIPFENPLSYIYSNNKLIEYALSKNIIITGPSTLICALRIINYSWQEKNQYENMREITKLGLSIYEKMIVFLQKIEETKTSFETLKKKFESLFKTIQGQNGLIGQVEKLKEYGVNPPKNIEEKYIEDSSLISNEI